MRQLTQNLLLALIALINVRAFAQHDERTVNGVTVDIAPVHQWFSQTSKGAERPMRHWQKLVVLDYRRTIASWDLCRIRTEDGAEAELLIAHLPQQIKSAFEKFNKAKAELDSLREEMQAQESRLAMLSPPVNRACALEAACLRQQLQAKKARLQLLQSQVGFDGYLSVESSDYGTRVFDSAHGGTLRAEVTRVTRTPLLAMFSGRVYAKVPIWDTGMLSTGIAGVL